MYNLDRSFYLYVSGNRAKPSSNAFFEFFLREIFMDTCWWKPPVAKLAFTQLCTLLFTVCTWCCLIFFFLVQVPSNSNNLVISKTVLANVRVHSSFSLRVVVVPNLVAKYECFLLSKTKSLKPLTKSCTVHDLVNNVSDQVSQNVFL